MEQHPNFAVSPFRVNGRLKGASQFLDRHAPTGRTVFRRADLAVGSGTNMIQLAVTRRPFPN